MCRGGTACVKFAKSLRFANTGFYSTEQCCSLNNLNIEQKHREHCTLNNLNIEQKHQEHCSLNNLNIEQKHREHCTLNTLWTSSKNTCTFTDLAWIYLLVRPKAWSCDAWTQICLQYSCHSCAALCSMALRHLHCCREGRIAKSLVFSHMQAASSWIHIFGSFQLAYFLSVSIVWHWIGMEGVALFLPLGTNLRFSAVVS